MTGQVKDSWKLSVEILDVVTGETVHGPELLTDDEEAVLTADERVSHCEVAALAFSPDAGVLAVGTNVGQVILFDLRSGRRICSLDDREARLANKESPDHWRMLPRAMGSVSSLAFSPDGSLLAMCGHSFGDFAESLQKRGGSASQDRSRSAEGVGHRNPRTQA